MGDPAAVGVVERVGELAEEVESAAERERVLLLDEVAQGAALEQLHHNKVEPVLLGDVMDLHDVRVAQVGRQLRLPLEQPHEAVVGRQPRRRHLDGAGLLEHAVDAAVD